MFYIIIKKKKAVNLYTEIPSALEKKQHFNQSGKNTSAHEKSSTGTRLGLGTDLGTFKGTYRIASVLPSIDSH